MMRFTLTQSFPWKRALASIAFLISMSITAFTQTVNYGCQCNDDNDNYFNATVTITSGISGETYLISNVSNFSPTMGTGVPYPDGFQISEDPLAPGTYILTGFVLDGDTPNIDVDRVNSLGGITWSESITMRTCSRGTFTQAGDLAVCVNSGTESYSLTNSLPTNTFENVSVLISDASAGLVVSGPTVNSNMISFDINWVRAGTYTVAVSGMYENLECSLYETFSVTVRTVTAAISGPSELCADQAEGGNITFTYSSDNAMNNDVITWDITGGNAVLASANGAYTMDIDFLNGGAPGSTVGSYTVSVSGNSGDCVINESFEVEVVSGLELGFEQGSVFACEASIETYTLDLAANQTISLQAGGWVLERITTNGVPTPPVFVDNSLSIAPAAVIIGGSNDEVSIDFSDPVMILNETYRLTAIGSVFENAVLTCPYEASIDVFYAEEETTAIACNNQVNLSMNLDCEIEFTPNMILQGLDIVEDAYDLVLTDANGNVLADNTFTAQHIGMTFTVMVIQKCGDNSCWGTVLVEDKTIPTLAPFCANDILTPGDCSDLDFNSDLSLNAGAPTFPVDITVSYNGDETWNLEGYDNCGSATLSYSDSADFTCADNTITVTRTWVATDLNSGSMSSCDVDIVVNMDDIIVMPPNYDSSISPTPGTLSPCDTWPTNPDGTPHPDFTGYPEVPVCSKITVGGFNDVIIPICGDNSMKILRVWSFADECGTVITDMTQIIKVLDIEPPICSVPTEQTVYADKHTCTIDRLELIPPVVVDCSEVIITASYKVRDPLTGIIPSDFEVLPPNTFVVEDVDATADSIWVRYVVEDICGNRAIDINPAVGGSIYDGCFYEIAIVDTTQPTPVCDLYSTVSLNDQGCAYAWPRTFDDYSTDNCAVYERVVRRMDADQNPCDCEDRNPEFEFADYLGSYNGHYYYLSKTITTGPKAFAYSFALDAYPVMIGSAAEGTWLNTQIRAITDQPYYVGLYANAPNSLVNASDYEWANGSTNTYRNWAPGNPPVLQNIGTGNVYVYADETGEWFSNRESEILGFYVVEMEDPCGWTQEIKFCCEDLTNDELMVQMRVIDVNGNHNFCMVQVDVQDHTPPFIQAPADVTIDCTDDVDAIVAAGTPTTDPLDDVCGVTVTMDMTSSSFECEEGVKRVTYTATDAAGNTATDVWVISIQNLTPFNGNINFPNDVTLNATNDFCDISDLNPSDLGPNNDFPTWTSDACANVTYSYDDQVYYNTDEACMKVLRTWTVIDWCQAGRYWTGVQVIKLLDAIAPVFDPITCQREDFVGTAVGPNCLVDVGPVTAVATDNCTEDDDLIWTYTLNIDGGGIVTGNSPVVNGPFPEGTHTVSWTVEDHCGNIAQSCTKTFTVTDNKSPIAYCLDLVVTSLDPFSEDAVIWASDLVRIDDSVPCNGDVSYSFSTNVNQTSLTLTCADISNGIKDTIYVDIYFTDASGNQSSCTAGIILQDNSDVCPDDQTSSPRGEIGGHVLTELNQNVDNVSIEVTSNIPEFPQFDFTVDGGYAFGDILMYENYNISAVKDDNYLNGVSTLDIVLIQKHILGLETLNSPYKIIAADANNSRSVSSIDLIELRKLILGIYNELPENDSWRFVDANFLFPNPSNPWPFVEEISINNISKSEMNLDFIGVKIGDVNESVDPSYITGDDTVDARNRTNVEIEVQSTDEGLALVATDNYNLAGAQFTMRFNSEEFEVYDMISGVMEINGQNFNTALLEDGYIAFSWNKADAINVINGDVLFELKTNSFGNDLARLDVIEQPVKSEMYLENNGTIEVANISLRNAEQTTNGFEVYQNTPNPFSNETTIGFRIDTQSDVFLQVTDYTGKVLYAESRMFDRGYNEFYIGSDILNTAGILYYQLSNNNQTISKKMVVLK